MSNTRVIPEPFENKFKFVDLSIDNVNELITTLTDMKKEMIENVEKYKKVISEHVPCEDEKLGRIGYHPTEERIVATASFTYHDMFTNKDHSVEFNSLEAGRESANEMMKDVDLLVPLQFIEEADEVSFNEMKDEIEVTTNYVLRESVATIEPNLKKAALQIKEKYLDTLDESFCFADFKWEPCGGVFVAEAINRFFLVENNITGLAITEISKDFFDKFVEEFKERKGE